MENQREEWYDKEMKVAVTVVDVKAAARALARGRLCGPTTEKKILDEFDRMGVPDR